MQRLKSIYLKQVIPNLKNEFGYKNLNQVPKIKKVVISRGFDESCQNSKVMESLLKEMGSISGQKPVLRNAKKAIANFKVKEKMPVGMVVNLHKDKMYSFLDRLINLALPRIRDFQGLSKKGFDGRGNYSFGLTEQLMFPEIEFDKVSKIEGMNITIITTSEKDSEAIYLLTQLGMPFK